MAAKLWWLIQKDLVAEWRGRRVWPSTVLVGVIAAVVLVSQVERAAEQPGLVAGLYWVAVYFAGLQAIDRSLASEREENCWDGLIAYPVSPAVIFTAKLAANTIALLVLQGVLLPVFAALSAAPLLARPGGMLLIAALGAVGMAAVGTLFSALASGLRQSTGLLGLLTLPTLIPVILTASRATAILAAGEFNADFWRAAQLLAAFAVVFVTAGILLFEFAVED